MKIAACRLPSGERRAGIVDLEAGTFVEAGNSVLSIGPLGPAHVLAEIGLEAPVDRPGKVICVGLNYRDHAAESGMALPTAPMLFAKFANAVIGPEQAIELPSASKQVDYEAELAVVMGRPARGIAVDEAIEHVLGYTCANDVSARDLQFADGQWFRGKGQDTFCPLGPWLVTPDELTDPQSLAISCTVNGRTLQDSSTKEMIFSVAEVISFISAGITLDPGDVILTGTPVGVGFARNPQVFLQPGDKCVVAIEGIGELRNPVIAAG